MPKVSDDGLKSRSPMATTIKAVVLFVSLTAFGIGCWRYGEALELEQLETYESTLRNYQEAHPVLVYGVAFLVYATVAGLSLPGATVMSLVYGWYFGWLRGLVLVSFASTAGATLAFLLSHYLFREMVQRRFGDRLVDFNKKLAKDGPCYLFMLRLIPLVPFFVVNLVMGLTPIRTVTFWWVSQLGMLPGTAVYLYAGASVPSLSVLAEQGASGIISPRLLIAFTLLGIFPLLAQMVQRRWAPNAVAEGDAGNGESTTNNVMAKR